MKSKKQKNYYSHTVKIQNSSRGFTLLEILLVIGLIGLLSVVSVSAWRVFQPSLQLNGTIREVVSDLRHIQQLSITEQIEYCLKIFPDEKKYQIIQCDSSQLIEEKTFPAEITAVTVGGLTENQVEYNPYGAVQEEGTIVLENTRQESKTILIKASGFVKISN